MRPFTLKCCFDSKNCVQSYSLLFITPITKTRTVELHCHETCVDMCVVPLGGKPLTIQHHQRRINKAIKWLQRWTKLGELY